MDKKFKRYMNRYGAGFIVLTCIFGGYLILGTVLSIVNNQFSDSFILLILFAALVVASFIPLFISNKFFKSLELDAATARSVQAEFDNATPFRKGKLRLGENYIFVKRSGKLLKYSDIQQVYQSIVKTNFVESERTLKYVDSKGKTRQLCKLELRDKSRDELMQIISIIAQKNPGVKIGYR